MLLLLLLLLLLFLLLLLLLLPLEFCHQGHVAYHMSAELGIRV